MNQVEKHLYQQRIISGVLVMYFVLGWHFYAAVYTFRLGNLLSHT